MLRDPYFGAAKSGCPKSVFTDASQIGNRVQFGSFTGVHCWTVVYCTLSTAFCWKFAWLSKLNASARNFSPNRSFNLKMRATLKSMSRTPGPRNELNPSPGTIEKFTFDVSNTAVYGRPLAIVANEENVNPLNPRITGNHVPL